MFNKFFLTTSLLLIFALNFSCQHTSKKQEADAKPDSLQQKTTNYSHPEWIKSKTIYEINLRQFSEAGTLAEFQTQLGRLKSLGIDILWFMPIHPIGKKNRKGTLGSPYSVQDYRAVAPEYGTLEDFKNVVAAAHEQGMYVIIDWVANHTAWDNAMAIEHPEWFSKDSTGNFIPPIGTDWSDVIDLDYSQKGLRKYMIESMKFWLQEADIDGFRCDVASWVPSDFWLEARLELDQVKKVFMLAEAEDDLVLNQSGFDMCYGWNLHHIMNQIAEGKQTVKAIDDYFEKEASFSLSERYRMHFITNHDENSWNGTIAERMGESAKAWAVFAASIPGMPLIYNGQEAGLSKRLAFFEKDPIQWKEDPLQEFYSQLFKLRQTNPALWLPDEGVGIQRVRTSNDEAVFAFVRQAEQHRVFVVLNLSDKRQNISLDGKAYMGTYQSLFGDAETKFDKATNMQLQAWEYRLYYF